LARHVEICGGIAFGKTTLAHLIRGLNFQVLFEDFAANPFFSAFYEDPAAYSFEAEITFSLQHYHLIKRAKKGERAFCVDFSPYLDLAYSHVTLSASHLAAYRSVYTQIRDDIGPPDVLIRLQCPPNVALQRILRRGRPAELGIQVSYLQAVDEALTQVVASINSETLVVVINSHEMDFANDDLHRSSVIRSLEQNLGGMT
jgi:deoxyadenosine/deoxycytidine kinase